MCRFGLSPMLELGAPGVWVSDRWGTTAMFLHTGSGCPEAAQSRQSASWARNSVYHLLTNVCPRHCLPKSTPMIGDTKRLTSRVGLCDRVHIVSRSWERPTHFPRCAVFPISRVRPGVTQNDIEEAKLLDLIPVQYSPKWLREHPEASTATSPP